MPSQVIGRVQPVNQGNYDATRAYVVLDRVKHQGAWYECQADAAAGTAPEAGGNAYWLEIGGRGADGLTPTPVWNGSELHFAYSDGTTTSAVDLRGPQGVQGEQGVPGPTPPLTSDLTSTAADVALSALGGKTLKDVADSKTTAAEAAHAAMPNWDATINFSSLSQGASWQALSTPAPADGYLRVQGVANASGGGAVIGLRINGRQAPIYNYDGSNTAMNFVAMTPVNAGDTFEIFFKVSRNSASTDACSITFIYAYGTTPTI